MDEIAIKNIAKYSPYSRRSFLENLSANGSKYNDHLCDTKKLMIKPEMNRKYSPTQKMFLDNVILPVANEVNTRIVQKVPYVANDKDDDDVKTPNVEIISTDQIKS